MARVEREREELLGVVRCLPAWTRRRVDGGSEVRRETRCRRVVTGVDEGMVMGIARGKGVSYIGKVRQGEVGEGHTFAREELDEDLLVINWF